MYPQRVDINEKSIEKLTATFKQAYKAIYDEIATSTDFGVANRKAILAQIEGILTDLGENAQAFVEKEIKAQYITGANQAVAQLRNTGADVSVAEGFNRIHTNAIAALVDDTSRAFGESLTGVDRSAQLLLGKISRETLTQKLAEGMIGGKARKEVVKVIKGTLQQQGLDALIDKGGKKWTLDRYSDMLFRTKAVEARNRGMINRMAENNYDLVQVSAHGATDECGDWEGQILSVTGATPGYNTVADAEAGGLFHPNCKHAINVIIPSIAKLTNAYDFGTGGLMLPGVGLLKPYQTVVSKSLIPQATKFKAIFDKKMQIISDQTGMDFKAGPVKKAPRTAEKVLYDYNGNVLGMKDVNRSVIYMSDPNDKRALDTLIASTEKQFGKLDPKTDIKNDLGITNGYASGKLSVKTPYGAKAEIQITTPEMWDAKTRLGGDKMYGEWRDPNTDPERKRVLFNEMEKLYSRASQMTQERLVGN